MTKFISGFSKAGKGIEIFTNILIFCGKTTER